MNRTTGPTEPPPSISGPRYGQSHLPAQISELASPTYAVPSAGFQPPLAIHQKEF